MIRSTIINIVDEFLITIPNSLTMPPIVMRSMITSRGLCLMVDGDGDGDDGGDGGSGWILTASGRGCCATSCFQRLLWRISYGALHGSCLV